MSGHDPGLPDIDTGTPHPARIYDCLLGGKDHFPADRKAAEQILAAVPQAGAMARANRAFLQRAVRFLAAEASIGQFLDLGSGLPTHGNVHQVARQIAPEAKVVYVDNDPIVHAHGNALLADEQTTILFADLREPARIVDHPKVRRLLDLDQPVGVLLVAILHFVRDREDPAGIVAQLRDAMAPGSYLVLSHATADFDPAAANTAARAYDRATAPLTLRRHAEVARLFDGLELVTPGLVPMPGS